MASSSESPEVLITRLRQQLILAQVRIMELEDRRDELEPKLAEIEQLLGESQILTEWKVGEAAHLEQVRTDLQDQYTHLQHIQHVTHNALEDTRAEVQAKSQQIEALLGETELLQTLARRQADESQRQIAQISALEHERAVLREASTAHVARIAQLDTEMRAMKASRSWRMTAWLRSLERRFR